MPYKAIIPDLSMEKGCCCSLNIQLSLFLSHFLKFFKRRKMYKDEEEISDKEKLNDLPEEKYEVCDGEYEIIQKVLTNEELDMSDFISLKRVLELDPKILELTKVQENIMHILTQYYQEENFDATLNVLISVLKHSNKNNFSSDDIEFIINALMHSFGKSENDIFFEYLSMVLSKNIFSLYNDEYDNEQIIKIINCFLKYAHSVLMDVVQREKYEYIIAGVKEIVCTQSFIIDTLVKSNIFSLIETCKTSHAEENIVNSIIEIIRNCVDDIHLASKLLEENEYLLIIFDTTDEKKAILKLIIALGKYFNENSCFINLALIILAKFIENFAELTTNDKKLFIQYFHWITRNINHDAISAFIENSSSPIDLILEQLVDSCQDKSENTVIPVIEISIYFLTLPESDFSRHFEEIANMELFSGLIELCNDIENQNIQKKFDYLKVCLDDFFECEEECI